MQPIESPKNRKRPLVRSRNKFLSAEEARGRTDIRFSALPIIRTLTLSLYTLCLSIYRCVYVYMCCLALRFSGLVRDPSVKSSEKRVTRAKIVPKRPPRTYVTENGIRRNVTRTYENLQRCSMSTVNRNSRRKNKKTRMNKRSSSRSK